MKTTVLITFSAGARAQNPDDVIGRADRAINQPKTGKNRVVVAE
jgi:PleD family two-component response regulator